MQSPSRAQMAKNTSRRNIPHCFTRSALDRNFTAMASSINPKTTFNSFIQPPDLGRDCSQFGNRANSTKGRPSPSPKPAMQAVSCQAPCWLPIEPKISVPRMPLVQEKETMTKVAAIKNIPRKSPRPERASTFEAKPPGREISKYPKNEMAKTMNTTKKQRFSGTFVEILLRISGGRFRIWKGRLSKTKMRKIEKPYQSAFTIPFLRLAERLVKNETVSGMSGKMQGRSKENSPAPKPIKNNFQ